MIKIIEKNMCIIFKIQKKKRSKHNVLIQQGIA